MRRAIFFSVLGAATATVLMGATFAVASQVGFVLGSTANAPDALTAVTAQNKDGKGGIGGAMVQLTNKSTGSAATALGLTVGTGRPPLTVNSSTKVANLNADRLDGFDSAALQRRVTGTCAGGTALRGISTDGSVACQDTRTSNVSINGGSALALPFSFSVQTHGGPLLLFLSGSGWRTGAQGPGYVVMNLIIDGGYYDTARVFTNETNSHKALVPSMNMVTLPAGTHQVSVQLTSGTADGSDEFHYAILELPH
jgi:hypothetical protein